MFQVAIAAILKVLETGQEFCVCTTHLKARNGALLSKLRNEQGKDLLKFAEEFAVDQPIIVCGDFNAEPWEPVYGTMVDSKSLPLSSAYADAMALLKVKESSGSNSNSSADRKVVADETAQKDRSEMLAENEPPFTTWKIREDGEVCHTIDYVFYSEDKFKVSLFCF